jgi:hypothetical protein
MAKQNLGAVSMKTVSAIAAAILVTAASVLGPAAPVAAQEQRPILGQRVASVTYGPYLRFELGAARVSPADGYWLVPGYPNDPQVNFDLSGENVSFGAIAVGFDWQNGWRGDLSLLTTGSSSVAGPCSSASDGSPCTDHADISAASVRTRALMASLFYAPLEAKGSHSVFQPFVVGGLGLASNSVGEWTRYNENAQGGPGDVSRTFGGDSSTGIAVSVGVGASWQVTRPGKWPVILEAAWRYYDFGSASGSPVPVTGRGQEPAGPLTFHTRDQVVSIGVRVPLKRC